MVRIWIWLLKVGFVVGATALAWFNLSAAIIAICAVVLVGVSGKLESLVEISFGPLKAKIERNLTESERLLKGLKQLASVQARAVNSASVNTGRFASGDDWIFQSMRRIEAGLVELGLDENQIIEARSDVVRFTIRDAGSAATGGNFVLQESQECESEWFELRRSGIENPDAVEAYLKRWDRLEPDRIQRIEDMRWMTTHRDVRDVAQYMRAQTAVPWKEGQI